MLLSHLTCGSSSSPRAWSVADKSDVFLAVVMDVMAERFRFRDEEEGFVKASEPSPFCGARARDVTNVGSKEHSDR